MADCWDAGVPVESTSWDVFVSYARADHQAVDGLVEALRALGITVWRDVARIDSFDGITARLEEGIAGARLVVMCLSHTYPSRPACQWEALQVLRRLPPGQVTARLCPVAVTAGAGLASWPILSDLQVPEAVGTAVGDGDPWSHAAGAVRARLDALGPIAGGGRAPIGPAPDQPVVWLPGLPRQSATFTGRFTEMLELHSLLTSDRAGLDSGRTGVRLPVAVVGMGGVGKTLLVQEYVRHFSGSWPVVVRVNAAGDRFGHRIAGDEVRAVWLAGLAQELRILREVLAVRDVARGQGDDEPAGPAVGGEPAGSTSGLGAELNPVGRTRSLIDGQLQGLAVALRGRGPVLWWIDDVPDGVAGDFARLLSPAPDGGATLFTTRSSEFSQSSHEMDVAPFPPATGAGAALLAKHRPGRDRAGRLRPVAASEAPAIGRIVDLLGGLPLALDVTGARVARRSLTWPEAADALARDALRDDARAVPGLPTEHTSSLAATFTASLDHLAEQSPEGLRALLACVLLGAGQPIPKVLLAEVLSADACPLDEWVLGSALETPLGLRLLTADDATVRIHELIARVAVRSAHMGGESSALVRRRIASLATDPLWVAKALPALGLPLVTQLLEAHDPNAPLARIVRTQAHNISRASGKSAGQRVVTWLAWEALRQGQQEMHADLATAIRGMGGQRFLPIATIDRTDPRLRRILPSRSVVVHVAFQMMPDGRELLVSVTKDRAVRMWDPATGNPVGAPIPGNANRSLTAAFPGLVPGQVPGASGFEDPTLLLSWDPVTGMPHDQPYPRPAEDAPRNESWQWYAAKLGMRWGMSGIGPDGRTLQLVRGAGSLQFRDPIARAPLGPPVQWHANWESARSFALGADGRVLLASGADDCSVSVWDATTGVPVVPPLHGHTRTVNAVAFGVGPDGQLLLASGSSDGTVRLWDPLAGALLGDPMVGHVDRVLTVALGGGPDGSVMLASGSDDGTVRIWAPQAGRALDSPGGHDDWVTSVALGVGPLGRALVASGSADRTVRVWDPATGRALGGPLVGHANWVTSVAFGVAADGRLLLASGSSDGTVRVWDPVAGVSVGAPLTGHRSGVTSVAFGVAADGRLLLASGSSDRTVRVWDPVAGELVGAPLTGHRSGVTSVAFGVADDGRLLLASGSLSGPPCLVHDPDTGRAISSCAALHVVAAVAFGSGTGGRALLATGYGAQIAMVDPLDGKDVWLSTVGHGWASDGLTSLALGELPDGRALLVTGGRDSSARVFDPVSGRLLGEPLTGFPGPVACVAIGLDGAGRLLIVTAAGNGWTTFELLGW